MFRCNRDLIDTMAYQASLEDKQSNHEIIVILSNGSVYLS
jgi:hypothetical protein